MLIICGDLERLQKAHRMALSGECISMRADKVCTLRKGIVHFWQIQLSVNFAEEELKKQHKSKYHSLPLSLPVSCLTLISSAVFMSI